MKRRAVKIFSSIIFVMVIISLPVLADVLDDISYVDDTNKYNNVPASYYEYAKADTLSTYLTDTERINGSFALAFIDDNDIPDLCWKKYKEGSCVSGIVTHLNGKEIKAYAGITISDDNDYMVDYYFPRKCSYMSDVLMKYNDTIYSRSYFYIRDNVNAWLAYCSPNQNKYLTKPDDYNHDKQEIENIVKGKIGSAKRVKINWHKNTEANRKKYLYDLQAAVSSISLSKTSLTIQQGNSVTLKATVKGKSKTVTWKSSDIAVATVDKNGKVTGKKAGNTTIIATANGVSAKCKVSVVKKSSSGDTNNSISLSKTSLTIQQGKSTTLKATVKGKSKIVTWKSSDKSIATVDQNGKVTGKKEGMATITATANGVSAKCKVSVVKKTSSGVESNIIDICVSSGNTAVVKQDNSLWMCGGNSEGALGDGTRVDKYTLEKVMGDVKSVCVSYGTVGVIKTDKTLWMWGNNYYGIIGNGISDEVRYKPVKVMSGVKTVSIGVSITAILKTDGTLWTCGNNYFGQLGDGTFIDKYKPIKIMTGVKDVSVGNNHMAILKTDGSLWMCGANAYGQLGDGTYDNKNIPIRIMTGVKSVSAGTGYTAIIKTDGSLWTCGCNNVGQLGDGTYTRRNRPVKVMTGVKSVSAGLEHTAIIKTDGSMWTCGGSSYGKLCLGDVDVTNPNKFQKAITGVKAVSAGVYHTAILKTDGTLWTVGENSNGQLGDGTTEYRSELICILGK